MKPNFFARLARFQTLALANVAVALSAVIGFTSVAGAAPACEMVFESSVYNMIRFDRSAFNQEWAELTANSRASVSAPSAGAPFRVLIKSLRPARLRILVTAGVHGNEPLGVVTALDLIQLAMRDSRFDDVELVVMPALNLEGLANNQRRTLSGVDINRRFGRRFGEVIGESLPITTAVESAIADAVGSSGRFDIGLDLHGANPRQGFFVIKSGDDQGVAQNALSKIDPLLLMTTDDENIYTFEGPGLSTSQNEGTLKSYMAANAARVAYTLEYPGRLPPAVARTAYLDLVVRLISAAKLLPAR